jgi:hypothetical protein
MGAPNCQTLFGIGKIPSDNYIRDMLDVADPALLQPCFERMERLIATPPLHQAFVRLGDRTLIAWDGTEYFCSQKLGCPHCLRRKRANGKVESYHTLLAATAVAAGHSKVVPLFPEFIAPQDGAEKQDCERNAANRWHPKHADRLRTLRPIYLATICSPAAHRHHAGGRRRRFHLHLQGKFTQGALRFHRWRRARAARRNHPQGQCGRAAIGGSPVFRCATARMPRWSMGSRSRFSIATAPSNIPPSE